MLYSCDSSGGKDIQRENYDEFILKFGNEKMIVDWCLWLGILSREIQRKIYKELIVLLLLSNWNIWELIRQNKISSFIKKHPPKYYKKLNIKLSICETVLEDATFHQVSSISPD